MQLVQEGAIQLDELDHFCLGEQVIVAEKLGLIESMSMRWTDISCPTSPTFW
jgi:hypothetical protein